MKTRTTFSLLAPALLIAATAACSTGSVSTTGGSTGVTPPSSDVVATASCLSNVSQPLWKPSIVASADTVCPTEVVSAARSGTGATTSPDTNHLATIIEYKLSGAANQEALSKDPNVVSPTGQVETDITFVSYPDPNYMDPIDRAGSVDGIKVSTVKLSNGFDARLSQGTNGLGAVRVAWTDGKHSYLLLTTNYKTKSGTSGPSVNDMVTMAGSVPAAS